VPGRRRRQDVVPLLQGGNNSSHVRHVSVNPCGSTSGVPAPPRCAAVNKDTTNTA
jgi:hypothetical protein